MIVIILSNCPQKLKGDITRWLFEVETGVYVGNLNARVRDALWDRICDNIGNGRASMVYSTNNEQRFDFKIKGSQWEPVDFDGIKLVRRSFAEKSEAQYKRSSKVAVSHINALSQRSRAPTRIRDYVVVDIETTGINDDDRIIEIAALRVRKGDISGKYTTLVKCDKSIPEGIVRLTGITNSMLNSDGVDPKEALEGLKEFCNDDVLVGHNIQFDMRFLQKLCKQIGSEVLRNKLIDTLKLARKSIVLKESYSLSSIAAHFGIEARKIHRAEDDCILTYRVYEKLKDI